MKYSKDNKAASSGAHKLASLSYLTPLPQEVGYNFSLQPPNQ